MSAWLSRYWAHHFHKVLERDNTQVLIPFRLLVAVRPTPFLSQPVSWASIQLIQAAILKAAPSVQRFQGEPSPYWDVQEQVSNKQRQGKQGHGCLANVYLCHISLNICGCLALLKHPSLLAKEFVFCLPRGTCDKRKGKCWKGGPCQETPL